MLHILTYFWGSKYRGYLEPLQAAVKRNLKQPHRMAVVSDTTDCLDALDSGTSLLPTWTADENLLDVPGCLIRLRTFDPAWQKVQGIKPGDRIVVLDLDLIVTGSLDELFDRDDSFTILQGVNAVNPNPYNGSVWMLKAGEHADVWNDFSIDAANKIPHYLLSDDQDWFHHKIPGAGAFGPGNGVYGFQKPGWPKGDALPDNARIVAFPGHRDPAQFTHLPWVKEHWL